MKLFQLSSMLLLVCLGACGTLGGGESGSQIITAQTVKKLHQRDWDLKGLTIEGRQIVMDVDATITIRFDAEGKVGGLAGINRYTGAYSVSAEGKLGWIKPGFAVTQRAGPPEVLDKERAYMEALGKVDAVILTGHTLLLQSDGASTILTFNENGH
jgi:heat shock protein HslJ